MFTLMGNCISCIKKKRQPKRPVTLAILGLDSAGKTTTTNALLGDTLDTAPTIGFNQENIDFLNYKINLYDLGGGSKIRDIWKDYLAEIYGVIFVVDSAAPERFPEVREALTSLLQNDKVKGKPLLILANKEDKPEHVQEVDIMEDLNIENLVNQNKCYCHMKMCSAIKGSGRKLDPMIREGMTWLCCILDQLYDKMKERVKVDVEKRNEIIQKEQEARRERVKKQREERERLAEEERKKLGEEKVEDDDDEDDIINGDPFRRLDAEEIKRKEEKFERAKAKEKERQRKLKELENNSRPDNNGFTMKAINNNATPRNDDESDDGLRAPRSSRSLFGPGWTASSGHSRSLLPPLESLKDAKGSGTCPRSDKKRNKKMKNKVESRDINVNSEYSTPGHGHSTSMSRIEVEPINDHDDDDDSVIQSSGRLPFRKSRGLYVDDSGQDSPESGRKKKTKKKPQNLSSDNEDGFDTLRLSKHLDENDVSSYSKISTHSNESTRNHQNSPGFTNGITGNKSVTPVKKMKKKKKHLRKNKLAPSDDEFELSDIPNTPKKQPLGRTASPKIMLDDEDMHTNWQFVDDLPSADEIQQFRRSQPNFDVEDDLQL